MEAMYERASVNAKAEPNLTFIFTRDRFIFASVHCLFFSYERKFYSRNHLKITRQWKPTFSGNIPLFSHNCNMNYYCARTTEQLNLDLRNCAFLVV